MGTILPLTKHYNLKCNRCNWIDSWTAEVSTENSLDVGKQLLGQVKLVTKRLRSAVILYYVNNEYYPERIKMYTYVQSKRSFVSENLFQISDSFSFKNISTGLLMRNVK